MRLFASKYYYSRGITKIDVQIKQKSAKEVSIYEKKVIFLITFF